MPVLVGTWSPKNRTSLKAVNGTLNFLRIVKHMCYENLIFPSRGRPCQRMSESAWGIGALLCYVSCLVDRGSQGFGVLDYGHGACTSYWIKEAYWKDWSIDHEKSNGIFHEAENYT